MFRREGDEADNSHRTGHTDIFEQRCVIWFDVDRPRGESEQAIYVISRIRCSSSVGSLDRGEWLGHC